MKAKDVNEAELNARQFRQEGKVCQRRNPIVGKSNETDLAFSCLSVHRVESGSFKSHQSWKEYLSCGIFWKAELAKRSKYNAKG